MQGSVISPILFNLYLNDLIKELNNHAYEVIAYADVLCILCQEKSELLNIIKIIDKWTILNGIKVNKKMSWIMILKNDANDGNEIEDFPIIKEYKYLGITIDNKMRINSHIGMVDIKLNEYFKRNYVLNKRYFNVKSIMLIFGYFHKSGLLYGFPAFIEQKSWINRIDKIMVKNIKKLLKLPNRTNNERLKISLGLPNLNIYLIGRLLKLKVK